MRDAALYEVKIKREVPGPTPEISITNTYIVLANSQESAEVHTALLKNGSEHVSTRRIEGYIYPVPSR